MYFASRVAIECERVVTLHTILIPDNITQAYIAFSYNTSHRHTAGMSSVFHFQVDDLIWAVNFKLFVPFWFCSSFLACPVLLVACLKRYVWSLS